MCFYKNPSSHLRLTQDGYQFRQWLDYKAMVQILRPFLANLRGKSFMDALDPVEAGSSKGQNGYSPRQQKPAALAVELGDNDACQMIKPALVFPELKE